MDYPTYRSAVMHMQNRNRKVTFSEFKGWVTVRHNDGSCFVFMNGLIEVYKEWYVLVYSEHQQPMLLHTEDLDFAGYGVGIEAAETDVLDRPFVFMVEKSSELNRTRIHLYWEHDLKGIDVSVSYLERVDNIAAAQLRIRDFRRLSKEAKLNMIDRFNKTMP